MTREMTAEELEIIEKGRKLIPELERLAEIKAITTPEPGSDEAVEKGCLCRPCWGWRPPVWDGRFEIFIRRDVKCPLHGGD